jgi:hypothetical protein
MLFGRVESVDDLQNEWRNPYLQWHAAGMPAFNTGDLSPYKQIRIKFKTKEDRQAFAEKFGYSLTDKTAVVWYPDKGRERNNMNRIIEDE